MSSSEEETVTHMAGKEVETNHHDNDHHGHEVLGRHYRCSRNRQDNVLELYFINDAN